MSSAPSPQQRLHETRDQLRELLVNSDEQQGSGEFPRSATMRFLVNGGGKGVAGAVASAVLFRMAPASGRLLKFIPFSAVTKMLLKRRGTRSRRV